MFMPNKINNRKNRKRNSPAASFMKSHGGRKLFSGKRISGIEKTDASFFRAFDASPVASALVSVTSGKYIDVNRKFLQLFESPRAKVIGRTPEELGFWFDAEERKKVLDDFGKNENGKSYVFKIRSRKGKVKDVMVSVEPVDVKGEKCYLGHLVDVSERIKASDEIVKNERKFRALLENSRDVIFNFDIKKGEYNYVSPSAREVLGIDPEEFIARKYGVLVSRSHREDRKRIKDHFEKIFRLRGRKKKSFFVEYRILFNKKEYKWVADNHTIVYDSRGIPESLIGNITDVTFRKEAQEQLVKSYELQKGYLELLTSLQNALPAYIAMLDKNGNIVAVNDSWGKYSDGNSLIHNDLSREANYIRICRLCKGEYSAEGKEAAKGIQKVLAGKAEEFHVEYPCRTQTGQIWQRLIVTPINRGKNEGAVVMHIDVTERKEAELALKLSEEQYKLLFYDNPLPMWVFDSDTLRIIAVNDESILCYGFSKREFLKKKVTDLIHPDERKKYLEYRKTSGKHDPGEGTRNVGIWKHVTKKGGIIDVEVTRRNVFYEGRRAVLVLAKDITTRVRAEEALKSRTEELTLLYESSRELSNTLEIQSIYERIYKIVSMLMPSSGMGISSFDEESRLITAQVIWQDGRKHDTSKIPPIEFDEKGKGLQSRVIKTRKSVIIDNYDKYLRERRKVYYIEEDSSISSKRSRKYEIAKSALLVPLITEGKVIGVIQILSSRNNAFTEENLKILEALSSQAAAAMTNARLYQRAQIEIAEKQKVQEALRRKSEELSILYEAQKKITNTLDTNIVFDNIYKSVSAIMPCDSMIISSFRKEEKMIKIMAVWADGEKPSIKDYPELPLAPKGYGIQSEVIRSGESKLILDYEKHFKRSKSNYSYTNNEISSKTKSLYSSALLVPMKLEGDVIGTIQVLSYRKNAFNEDNLRMLESLTPPITAATVNAGLYQQAQNELAEKQKAKEALSKKNEEIILLYEAGRELSGSLDIENIYEVLYANMSRIISCGSMIISSYDIEENLITCRAAWVENTKHDPKKFPQLRLTGELTGTQGEAIREKRSIIVNNFYEVVQRSKEKFYIDDSGNVVDYHNENELIDEDAPVTKSAMFVPMKLGEKVIGVISVFSFEENAYSDYDLRMLESLSTQVAAVTANAELYARAQNEIDERIKKETELKVIRRNMEEAQRIAHIGNWVLNVRTDEIYNSAEVYNIMGIEPVKNYVPFKQLLDSIHKEDRGLTEKLIREAIRERKSYINEDRIIRPGGEVRHVRIMGEPVIDSNGILVSMQGTMQDITDLKSINDELVRSLAEKELMLKEIHHRVKNNLQVVSSLLRLQSEKIKDKTTVEYFKLSEQRVKSMALIHQQLYNTKDLSMINFRSYLQELCSYLFFVNGISSERINLNIMVGEIYFGIDTALPCGLIINELVTNSIKHAFPGGRKGNISINLVENKDTGNQLVIKDDGIGAGKLDFKNTETLGMELVDTLTDQLEGRLEVNTEHGTEIRIIFKELFYKKRL